MNKITLKALRSSIKKWQRIVDNGGRRPWGTGPSEAHSCGLCHRFIMQQHGAIPLAGKGENCPVSDWVHKNLTEDELLGLHITDTRCCDCSGTPYHHEKDVKTAQAELDFLISLLPEGEPVEGEHWTVEELIGKKTQ